MNCANHPGVPATAYCRTCGKPLCDSCKRDVMGVIYCEQCLADRLGEVHPNIPTPPPAFVSSAPMGTMPGAMPGNVLAAGPHPAVAAILASFFPFGVGAVYTGQYAKGLAHLLIFTGLVWSLSAGHFGGLEPVLGIAMGFFWVYQVIDAIRSANAVRMGQAPPDPFGFNRTFGMSDRPVATVTSPGVASPPGELPATHSTVPTAAVVLIGLGVLFLLQTAGIFEFNVERIWPLFLVGLGVWLFVTRAGLVGHPSHPNRAWAGPIWEGNPWTYNRRVWSGPLWLVTIGLLFLIQSFGGPGFGRTWPVLLLVAGLVKVLGNATPPVPPPGGPVPPAAYESTPTPPPANPSPSSEVKNG